MKKLNWKRWWDERRARGESSPPPTSTAPGTPLPRWPLFLIALPAAVAIWSGWVGLGELCGFGVINLLPGIGGGFHLNTAITLPVGVEAYAGFALGVWLRNSPVPGDARTFAKRSAIGALVYGMAGQVTFHLLTAWHAAAAPWPVVVVVSCMPVAVLGLAAALMHLLRAPAASSGAVSAAPFTDAQTAAAKALADTWTAGNPLSQRQLMTRFRLTRGEESRVRTAVIPATNGDGPHE